MDSPANEERSGVGQAAVLSGMLGILTLAVLNVGCEVSGGFRSFVYGIGTCWLPPIAKFSPYSVKEVLSYAVWLGSWYVLHRKLCTKKWNMRLVFAASLAGVSLAAALLAPPVFSLFAQH